MMNKILVHCSTEEKKLKPKLVDALFHDAINDLPDAALSAVLHTHTEKYLDYFRR